MPHKKICAKSTPLNKILQTTKPVKLIVGDPRKTAKEIPNLSEACRVVKIQDGSYLKIQILEDVTICSFIGEKNETCSSVEIAR